MKLYLLSQDERTGYDTFDAVVVAAESEEDARTIHPTMEGNNWTSMAWASSPDNVSVRELGVAAKGIKRGAILKSFNAG